MKLKSFSGPSKLLSVWHRLSGHTPLLSDQLCGIPVMATSFRTLRSPCEFAKTLTEHILGAQQRIFISALYLEDDEAGRAVLDAVYTAKDARPELEVAVFVDWHRAQRGLIGKTPSQGNATLYKAKALERGPGVPVYGVPVQKSELMGILHLKGIVIDDNVFYSGASLNNVYLHWKENYRLDRYHLIHSPALADTMAGLLGNVLRANSAVHPLDTTKTPVTVEIRGKIARFRRLLGTTRYTFEKEGLAPGHVYITPLLGIGVRRNEINATILNLIRQVERHLVLFTPYFNLPGPIRRAISRKIQAGRRITIVLGDKAANDFYIPPDQPFKAIGAIPYLYEANLRRFCKTYQKAIDSRLLNIYAWRHDTNTFHVKGMLVDENFMLLTGHNLNPRAWRLDLENALLIHDPQRLLAAQNRAEIQRITAHARRIDHYEEIETTDTYPPPVRRLIRRLARIRIDRLLNQIL
ncbi:MAG: CDP-diacylglycerol--serine O-phosphatidyltransferase [Candidatus Accumulibacter sp.]|nr:CDP-diacylglycerol--serine O-phosphatidyltransferase [Accumulibacter sp.]